MCFLKLYLASDSSSSGRSDIGSLFAKEEQIKGGSCRIIFYPFVTQAGPVYGVTDTDYWAQIGGVHGLYFHPVYL